MSKVLSIREPFASLIAKKTKKIETRNWKTKYRGEIYIHASKTKTKKERLNSIKEYYNEDELNYGKIICKCKLKDCIYMDENFIKEISKNKTEYVLGKYEIGRYAWVLDEVEILENKEEVNGKLGIWNYELKEKE